MVNQVSVVHYELKCLVWYFFLLALFCFCFVIISVPPQFIKTPERVIKVTANSLASVSCQAFGSPPPMIVWSRGLVPLPRGRNTVVNGTLNISNFSPQDVGPYQCKATNKLGSVTSLTTLRYVKQGKDQLWMNVFYTTIPMTAIIITTIIITARFPSDVSAQDFRSPQSSGS